MSERIARRHEALKRVTDPLPGSVPYENRRPVRVPERLDGMTILEVLEGLFRSFRGSSGWSTSRRGTCWIRADAVAAPEQPTRAGEEWTRVFPGTIEPAVNAAIEVLYEDEAIIVLNKPAPLPMHACGRFNRNTLSHFLHAAWHPEKPKPAHRLDANTSGVVVCARTRHFAKLLQPQFTRGEVEKVYLARVHGHPAEDEFTIDAPISDEADAARGAGDRGGWSGGGDGVPGAATGCGRHFAVRSAPSNRSDQPDPHPPVARGISDHGGSGVFAGGEARGYPDFGGGGSDDGAACVEAVVPASVGWGEGGFRGGGAGVGVNVAAVCDRR